MRDGDPSSVLAAIGVLLRAIVAAREGMRWIGGCRQNLLAQGEGRDLALGEVEEGALAAATGFHHGRDDDPVANSDTI